MVVINVSTVPAGIETIEKLLINSNEFLLVFCTRYNILLLPLCKGCTIYI